MRCCCRKQLCEDFNRVLWQQEAAVFEIRSYLLRDTFWNLCPELFSCLGTAVKCSLPLWFCLHCLCFMPFAALSIFMSLLVWCLSFGVCECVCVSGYCPWSTWSGVGSGSVWQRPRPGWLPGEVAYSFSLILTLFWCASHVTSITAFCYFSPCFS